MVMVIKCVIIYCRYPPGNGHISHQTGKGKSYSKVFWEYVSSQKGTTYSTKGIPSNQHGHQIQPGWIFYKVGVSDPVLHGVTSGPYKYGFFTPVKAMGILGPPCRGSPFTTGPCLVLGGASFGRWDETTSTFRL